MTHALEVADSFVGRWFKLEGSGVPNQRRGSRFLVRIWSILTHLSLTYQCAVDRAPRRTHDMGRCDSYCYLSPDLIDHSDPGCDGIHRQSAIINPA